MQPTGVVIAAASRRVARPIARLGRLSLVQRLTRSYQKAGVDEIVVVTGFEDPEIRSALMHEGVTFVNLEDHEDPELIQSYRIGLRWLGARCRRIFLTPVNTPMYRHTTIEALAAVAGPVVVPTYRGRPGHPVLIDVDLVDLLMTYRGERGLRGLLSEHPTWRQRVEVDDEGTVVSVRDMAALERLRPGHDASLVQPWCDLGIRTDRVIFDARTLLLLRLIDETRSVSGACRRMALSLTRAWQMLNDLECDLGYTVVDRAHGGSGGGRTQLNERGRAFVQAYLVHQRRVQHTVTRSFDEFWATVTDNRNGT